MRGAIRSWLLFAALSCASLPGLGAERVATVLDAELSRSELETAGDEPAQVTRFRDWVWERVFKHYVEEHGLAATATEIAALLAYHREFDRRDRAQRARKLVELHQRLADTGLGEAERARLEEFRKVLTRMAERDAENERDPPPEDARQAAQYAPWIEFWKANRALYEQYGGTVAATKNGPEPHGARVAVIADYERRGLLRFYDSRLRARLFELMSRPPTVVVPPEQVDFTPYWQWPIPPSYFPD